jgi:syntaxin-binding protein 5
VADENPIMIRTMERLDVNKATEEDLFGWSAQGEPGQIKSLNREPIFKLAWSSYPEGSWLERGDSESKSSIPAASPSLSTSTSSAAPVPRRLTSGNRARRSGTTYLTILGGLIPTDPAGVHVLEFPPMRLPLGQSKGSHGSNISGVLRQALRDSITPVTHDFYATPAPPEDFILLPKSTPHYGMTYDPTSIIITSGVDRSLPTIVAPHAINDIAAYSFPPARDPVPLQLPSALTWSGGATATHAELFSVESKVYERLIHQFEVEGEGNNRLPLEGGFCSPLAKSRKSTNRKPRETSYRIMVSLHADLSVRFHDVSSHLLQSTVDLSSIPSTLRYEYPRPLPHLTIHIRELLKQEAMEGFECSRIFRERSWELELESCISFAKGALEIR